MERWETPVIIRVWRGWTTADQAPVYERLLNETIAPEIMQRGIGGLRELAVVRRVAGELEPDGTVQFLTLMTFDDWAAVEDFAGPDAAQSVVPPAARAVLARHDAQSQHYELLRRHLPPDR
jgi:hypothetical protein